LVWRIQGRAAFETSALWERALVRIKPCEKRPITQAAACGKAQPIVMHHWQPALGTLIAGCFSSGSRVRAEPAGGAFQAAWRQPLKESVMSLVRLLGFSTLTCGCVVGRYLELSGNREVV
jgi:hypothetical protein